MQFDRSRSTIESRLISAIVIIIITIRAILGAVDGGRFLRRCRRERHNSRAID